MQPQITFWAGVGTVTGANFLFEAAGKKMLVDCGLLQGEKMAPQENRKPFPYAPAEMDLLFVTHAHLDHVGKIPKLVKDGFHGTIYSTPETRDLARFILEDAAHLLAKEAAADGVLPIYELPDIDRAMALWKTIPYHAKTEVAPGIAVYLRDAGHVLGSSMYEFSVGEGGGARKVVFTGDLGNSPSPLLRDTEAIEGADYLVMESTYGDRNHEPHAERKRKLARIVEDAALRKGTVVIPAFSLERTQVILFELGELFENGLAPKMPVFVDSPLATKITEVYERSGKFFNADVQAHIARGEDVFAPSGTHFTSDQRDSAHIDRVPGPKIIIAGSGMSNGGRVSTHESTYLPDPKNTILLVGYQSLGTLGRALEDGAASVSIHGAEVPVRAHIESIFGYSSHKDSDHLVDFVETAGKALRRAFVVMGEPKSSLFLVQRLRDELGVDALMPERGKPYRLE